MSGPDVKLYALAAPVAATGTVATVAGSGGIVGTGTHFNTELVAGDVVSIAGKLFYVGVIGSATTMAVLPSATATAGGLAMVNYDLHTTLASRGIWFPKGTFLPYSQPLDLGDGSLRGGGWPLAEWRWINLPRAQRDALRLINDPGLTFPASSSVIFKTQTNEQADSYGAFQAQMLWPPAETKDATRRLPFVLRFRALVALPTPV